MEGTKATSVRADFQLVIFDCDGVLVDSERLTNEVFAAMLNELGLPVTLEDMFEHFVGLAMAQCLERIALLLGRPAPPGFETAYRARTLAALREKLVPVAGIEAALDAIALPCCVASSGDHDKMRTTLGITGLWPRFEGRLFNVLDVAKPKPAPDVFLHAARCMGAEPSRCAVIEDTPTGVAAGVAAGMNVFGYAALTPAYRLRDAGAHHLFDDMRTLPGLLAALDRCT